MQSNKIIQSNTIVQSLRTSVALLVLFTILLGVLYPVVVTALAQSLFYHQASGSLVTNGGKVVGSENIGQPFSSEKYFWGRLSATTPVPYNASASSGSNLGPSNKMLVENARHRIEQLQKFSSELMRETPVDLVTASGSGLDPDISPQAAQIQIERVANARGLSQKIVQSLIEKNTQTPQFGILGESRVNVLQLNLALDRIQP